MWSLRLLWTWWKRINYLNSLLSTRKRTILTSSRTVLNAMIAMHVHRQLWLIILLLGIREKVNTGELFSFLWKVWKRSIILTSSFQPENVPFNIQSYRFECNDAMHVHRQLWLIILLLDIREQVKGGFPVMAETTCKLAASSRWQFFFVASTTASTRCLVQNFQLKADFLSSQKPLAAS